MEYTEIVNKIILAFIGFGLLLIYACCNLSGKISEEERRRDRENEEKIW